MDLTTRTHKAVPLGSWTQIAELFVILRQFLGNFGGASRNNVVVDLEAELSGQFD
jgi:hypothetical protein